MLILQRPWTRQPQTQALLSQLALSLGFDFAWSATRPNNSLLGQVMNTPQTIPRSVFSSGIALAGGYAIVNGVVPSMHTTTWTEIGVAYLDGTNEVITLSGRTAGEALVLAPAQLSSVCWNVASTNIGGALPAGITNYVVTRIGSAYSFWRNGRLHGTATSAAAPGAYAYLPAVGAQAGTGPNAGMTPLAATVGISLVLRTPIGISPGLALQLSANPWQLFQPRRIYIPTAAAAGYTHPTLSLATATEIGTTSFKPSVTYTFA